MNITTLVTTFLHVTSQKMKNKEKPWSPRLRDSRGESRPTRVLFSVLESFCEHGCQLTEPLKANKNTTGATIDLLNSSVKHESLRRPLERKCQESLLNVLECVSCSPALEAFIPGQECSTQEIPACVEH